MILHLDMDAFFASVEQMDNPALRGLPVIIGGGARGVVSTASYEARVFGIHSAMPVATARRLCPQGIFIPGRRARYVELSQRIMAALQDFSPLVEPASIDEAYLDATGLERLFGPLEELITAIKARVARVTGGLTCSVGAAPVKFLAKMCSEVNKPNGSFILHAQDVDTFLLPLEVGRLPGVGKRMVESLRDLGIVRVAQLRERGRDFLERRFGKWGVALYERAHGLDPRPVSPVQAPKSESAECTFDKDTQDRDFLLRMLMLHAERVGTSLRAQGLKGRTITLKLKYADFRQITRSRTLPISTSSTQSIFEQGRDLLDQIRLSQPVRLIGLGVSGFAEKPRQLSLLTALPAVSGQHQESRHGQPQTGAAPSAQEEARRQKLDQALDDLRHRFGAHVVQRGRIFRPQQAPQTQQNPQTQQAHASQPAAPCPARGEIRAEDRAEGRAEAQAAVTHDHKGTNGGTDRGTERADTTERTTFTRRPAR